MSDDVLERIRARVSFEDYWKHRPITDNASPRDNALMHFQAGRRAGKVEMRELAATVAEWFYQERKIEAAKDIAEAIRTLAKDCQ